MNLRARTIRSSIARLGSTATSLVISFLMMPFIVTSLGDHVYGLWIIVAGIETYYYLLDLGLSGAASRYISVKIASNDNQGVNQAVSTALLIFTGLGLVVALATVVAALAAGWLVQPEDKATVQTLIGLTGLGAAAGFPVKAYGGIVFSQLRHDLIEINNIVRRLIETALVYWALTHGYGVVAYAVILVTSNQVSSVYFFWLANRLWPALRVRLAYFDRALAHEMFRYSFWSLVNQASDMLRFRIDALVVGAYAGVSMATHFNVGSRLAELAFNMIYRATNFMIPLYASYHAKGDVSEIQAKLIAFTRVNAFLACFGGGLLIVFGEPFIQRWMGPAYVDAFPVLAVLTVGQIAEAVAMPANNVLFGVAKHRFYALASIVEAIVKLLLSLLLVTRFGIVGVALGTSIPLIVNKLFVIPWYTCRIIDLSRTSYYASLLPSFVLASAGMAISYVAARPFLENAGYGRILLAVCIVLIPMLAIAFYTVLTGPERQSIGRLGANLFARWTGRERIA